MDKIFKRVQFSVLILIVVTLATVLILVWTMPDLPSSPIKDKICLPEDNDNFQCGDTKDVLGNYLKRVTEREYTSVKRENKIKKETFLKENRVTLMHIYDNYFWEMKPAAKVTGKTLHKQHMSGKNKEMTPIKHWQHGRDLHDAGGFLRYGIRYRNGRLVVPVSGTYFLYSFVDMFEPCDHSSGKPMINDTNSPIKHGLFKFNILEEREIEVTSNIQPHVVSRNRYFNSYTSYISTLMELNSGDEISVKVSNITYLRHAKLNYFGLHLI